MKTFSQKLKQAMQELSLSQKQVVGLTGKSKASISQYLSDKQVPSESVQQDIALAMGLEADYFTKQSDKVVVMPSFEVRNGVIPKMKVDEAAKLLQMNHTSVAKGLQQGVFPWGYAIKTSEKGWAYFINRTRFFAIEGACEQ